MRVGIVSPYDLDAPGGVQSICRGLAERLERRGVAVALVGPGRGEGRAGRPVPVRANQSTVPLTLAPTAGRVVRRLLAEVDVVHVHEPAVPVVGWVAAGAPLPLVATFHADPPLWARRAYHLAASAISARLRGAVLTAVSPVAAAALPPSWGEVTIIPNAVDVSSYPEVPRHPQRVAFLGRDEPRKGLDVLLSAWEQVKHRHPQAELWVMGAQRADPPAGVVYCGTVDDAEKRAVLGSSAVFVAPNRGGESFGMVLIEAMAAGCAVVASSLPAFEAVLAGAGVTVPPGRADLLAAVLIDLLSDPRRVGILGEEAKVRASTFDWEVVADAYQAAYESALAADRSTIRAGRSSRGTWN